jgi:hypothetical protein
VTTRAGICSAVFNGRQGDRMSLCKHAQNVAQPTFCHY